MKATTDSKPKRTRLAPELRRRQILEAAAMVLEQGYLPLPLDRLAGTAGVSKALVYTYFPTQHDLLNAVAEQEFESLADAGIDAASARPDLMDAALGCADIYARHVAARGPILHIILRDQYMAGKLDRRLARRRDRIIRRLARTARTALRLRAKENIAAINMLITIPEEAGRMIHAGDMTHARGIELCADLMRSSIAALTPAGAQP